MSAEATEMSDKKAEDSPATLQVGGGEDVKLETGSQGEGDQATEQHPTAPECEIDMHDRDPNNMNDHVKGIKFQEIFGEPDNEVYSFETIWLLSFKAFTLTKLWMYRIFTAICGLPCSFCWAIHFACLAFCNIWCYIPCVKSCDLHCYCLRRVWTLCIGTFCVPFWEAFGKCFSNLKLHVVHEKV